MASRRVAIYFNPQGKCEATWNHMLDYHLFLINLDDVAKEPLPAFTMLKTLSTKINRLPNETFIYVVSSEFKTQLLVEYRTIDDVPEIDDANWRRLVGTLVPYESEKDAIIDVNNAYVESLMKLFKSRLRSSIQSLAVVLWLMSVEFTLFYESLGGYPFSNMDIRNFVSHNVVRTGVSSGELHFLTVKPPNWTLKESPSLISLEWSDLETAADLELPEQVRSFFAWIEISFRYNLDAFLMHQNIPYWICLTRLNPDKIINSALASMLAGDNPMLSHSPAIGIVDKGFIDFEFLPKEFTLDSPVQVKKYIRAGIRIPEYGY